MPLRDPFALRIAEIKAFLRIPPFRLLELSRPPDLELLVRKVLARMADDPADRHAWLYIAPGFVGYQAFFEEVVAAVAADVRRARTELDDVGMETPEPPELEQGIGDDGRDAPSRWAELAAGYLASVGEAMPDEAGALVLIIEPRGGGDRRALGWSLGALAWYLESTRVKLVVVDGGEDALVPTDGGVEDRVARADFAVPPEELEAQVLKDLAAGDLEPAEARQYRLMAGAFATSARRFDEAERRLHEALRETREAGEGGEEANVLYNLGTLYIRTERFEEASKSLTQAASTALETENHPLAAMALTNLGVALHREGRGREALESFGAAGALFRGLNHKPGEAHVLDCTARAWSVSDPGKAKELWRRAADLYDSITAPHLQEVKQAGQADIRAKIRYLDITRGTA